MILILGVTASGKASLAFELAKQINAEIISIDSMKVYRRMDLGTAKPSPEHRRQVNYHLIDVVEPSESFSVAAFLELTDQAIEKIRSKNKTVIAVGGTALYIKAMLFGLFEGPGSDNNIRDQLKQKARDQGIETLYKQLQQIDPEAALRIHLNDSKRIIRALEVYQLTSKPISSFQMQWNAEPKYDWTIIGLRREKEAESKRMNARVKKMIEAGLVDEVRSLLAEEKPMSEQARCAIGYAEIIDHLNGNTTLDETIELIKKNTRKLAKSQRTWFKTFKNVNWLDLQPDESPEQILEKAKNIIGSI
ncbi:MAG: tRNA (adenosine(37)-N6)-dimethylallyltransferase MiaA [Planctomycetota bacterium]|jgi:tRNA dimethylallyltransferase